MNRRKLVRSAVATGLVAGTGSLSMVSMAAQLPKTPRDYTGPFYPRGPRNHTYDLIVGTPRTDVLHLGGRVLTPDAAPRAGVVVDIWQTDPKGRYKHPRDRDQDRLMEEFLYHGEAVTDDAGRFHFRTYVPGGYRFRPVPHVHYKVWSDGDELLTSQIYFAGLGNPARHAKSREAATLQTTNLTPAGEGRLNADIDIVL